MMRRDEPGEVRGRTERAPIHFGEAEGSVLGGDDDIGIADQPDAAAEAEAVHGGDHRNGALVHRGECGVTPAVCADQRVEPGGALHFLDVDPGVEAAALGGQHDAVHALVT